MATSTARPSDTRLAENIPVIKILIPFIKDDSSYLQKVSNLLVTSQNH